MCYVEVLKQSNLSATIHLIRQKQAVNITTLDASLVFKGFSLSSIFHLFFYLDSFRSAFQITSSSIRNIQKQSFRLYSTETHGCNQPGDGQGSRKATLPGQSPILFQVHTSSIWLFSGIFQPHLCTLQGGLVLLLADGSWPFPWVVQMGTEYPQQWLKLEQFYRKH